MTNIVLRRWQHWSWNAVQHVGCSRDNPLQSEHGIYYLFKLCFQLLGISGQKIDILTDTPQKIMKFFPNESCFIFFKTWAWVCDLTGFKMTLGCSWQNCCFEHFGKPIWMSSSSPWGLNLLLQDLLFFSWLKLVPHLQLLQKEFRANQTPPWYYWIINGNIL